MTATHGVFIAIATLSALVAVAWVLVPLVPGRRTASAAMAAAMPLLAAGLYFALGTPQALDLADVCRESYLRHYSTIATSAEGVPSASA